MRCSKTRSQWSNAGIKVVPGDLINEDIETGDPQPQEA